MEAILHAMTYGLDIVTEIVLSPESRMHSSILDPMKEYRAQQAANAAAPPPAPPAAPAL